MRTLVLKVINNEQKILTHHAIIDCTAEQIVWVITQLYKKSKFLDSSELNGGQVSHLRGSLTFVS